MHCLKAVCVCLAIQMSICMNMATPSGMSEEQFSNGLRYELKPLASTFVEIEEEYEINGALLASIVALESGWGRSKMSQAKNNITSFRVGGEYKTYESKEECLFDMARNLSENYLKEDGKYYDGGTELEDICGFYLVGKPREEMSERERERVNEYVEIVAGIYEGIIERGTECVDFCVADEV